MKRGATRIPEPIEFKLVKPPAWVGRVVLALLIIAALVGTGTWLVKQIKWQVSSIALVSPLSYGNGEQLQRMLSAYEGQSLFDVRLVDIKETLEDDPWVKSASVQLLWPSSIEVTLVEQQPVALWNQDKLLSAQGEVFGPVPHDLTLPALSGPKMLSARVVSEYLTFRRLFEPLGVGIDQLALAERGAWTVTLSNGVVVELGARNTVERMARVKRWWQARANTEQTVEYIDARYDNGLAIGFQQNRQEGIQE